MKVSTLTAAAAFVMALSACQAQEEADVPIDAAAAEEVTADIVAEAAQTDAAAAAAPAATYETTEGATVTATATSDGDYRIVEGDRTYYYRSDDTTPYLVRQGNDYYTFADGRPDRVLDAQGRELPSARQQLARQEAADWAERGRELRQSAESRVEARTPPGTDANDHSASRDSNREPQASTQPAQQNRGDAKTGASSEQTKAGDADRDRRDDSRTPDRASTNQTAPGRSPQYRTQSPSGV